MGIRNLAVVKVAEVGIPEAGTLPVACATVSWYSYERGKVRSRIAVLRWVALGWRAAVLLGRWWTVVLWWWRSSVVWLLWWIAAVLLPLPREERHNGVW